ncbi:chitin synthase [Powellomyces hirtus]|uniref:chitin synthase n=1 Tax=Powellomyces hirtus TaxID=109895 RepID=A0A507E684_9FUNG|nr:chitin synthase [Powellomyces hirtus]
MGSDASQGGGGGGRRTPPTDEQLLTEYGLSLRTQDNGNLYTTTTTTSSPSSLASLSSLSNSINTTTTSNSNTYTNNSNHTSSYRPSSVRDSSQSRKRKLSGGAKDNPMAIDPTILAREGSVRSSGATWEEPLSTLSQQPSSWINTSSVFSKFARVITFPLPDALLRVCGMRTPQTRQAWREKVVIFSLVLLISGIFIFVVDFLGSLLAPADTDFTLSDLQQTQYVGVQGRVADFSTAQSPLAAEIKAEIEEYKGLDVSPLFPTFPLLAHPPNTTDRFVDPDIMDVVGAQGDAADNWLTARLAIDDGYGVNATRRRLDRCPSPVGAEEKSCQCFTTSALPLVDESAIGYIMHDRETLQYENNNLATTKALVVIDSFVYDVTWYLRIATGWGSNSYDIDNNGTVSINGTVIDGPRSEQGLNSTFNTSTMFLPADMTTALLANLGGDATAEFDHMPNRAQRIRVMNKLMFAGVLDESIPPSVSRMNPIMLAIGGYVYLVYVIKISMTLSQGFKLSRGKVGGPSTPFNVIFIPVYNEEAVTIQKSIESAVSSDYASDRKLLFVVVDGLAVQPGSYRDTATAVTGILGCGDKFPPEHEYVSVGVGARRNNIARIYAGKFTATTKEAPQIPYVVVVKSGLRHETRLPGTRGKRDSMLILMNFLKTILSSPKTVSNSHKMNLGPLDQALYTALTKDLGLDPREFEYLTVLDGDTFVAPDAITTLAGTLHREPKLMAVHGYIAPAPLLTKTTFATILQRYPWYHTHHLAPAMDSAFGTVGRAWSGGFALYRIVFPSTIDRDGYRVPCLVNANVVDAFSVTPRSMHDRNRFLLGEDKALAGILLAHHPRCNKLEYCSSAVAYSEVPTSFRAAMSQQVRAYNARLHTLLHLFARSPRFMIRSAAMYEVIAMVLAPVGWGMLNFMNFRTFYYLHFMKCPSIKLSHSDVLINIAITCLFVLQAVLFISRMNFKSVIPVFLHHFIGAYLFHIVLPVMALWKMDRLKWSDTVVVEGATPVRFHGADDIPDEGTGTPKPALRTRDKRKFSDADSPEMSPITVPPPSYTPMSEQTLTVDSAFLNMFDGLTSSTATRSASTSRTTYSSQRSSQPRSSQSHPVSVTMTMNRYHNNYSPHWSVSSDADTVKSGSAEGSSVSRARTVPPRLETAVPKFPRTSSHSLDSAATEAMTPRSMTLPRADRPPSDILTPNSASLSRRPTTNHHQQTNNSLLRTTLNRFTNSSDVTQRNFPRVVSDALSSRYHSGTNSTRTGVTTTSARSSAASTTILSTTADGNETDTRLHDLRAAIREEVRFHLIHDGARTADDVCDMLAIRFGDRVVDDFGLYIDECTEEYLLEAMALS